MEKEKNTIFPDLVITLHDTFMIIIEASTNITRLIILIK